MFSLLQQYFSQFLRAIDDAIARIRDGLADASESPIQDPATPATGSIIGSVSDGNGLLINVYGEEVGDSVHITVVVEQGVADLRGFFMDVGDTTSGVCVDGVARQDYAIGDESVTSVGARDNNMNGTGETFDVGIEIGSSGYGRDDVSQAHFTLEGVSLEQLDGLTFGVRATSVGEDRDDGVKLLGEFDTVPEVEEPPVEQPPVEQPPVAEQPPVEQPPVQTPPSVPPAETPAPTPSIGGNFPQMPDDITSITLFYNTPAGDITGDSLYAAKVEGVSWIVEDDLDLWLLDATGYLQKNDPNVDDSTQLLGVAITHGADGTTEFYAMDDNPGADAAPTADLQSSDMAVDYGMVMGY
jgi:hypothetical protein